MKAFPHNPTIFWRTPKIFGYILAFLSFLTLTFLTVKFFAPDVNSDAATKNISAGSTTAGYTLSAGFEDSVSIPVTPTSSQAVYSANHAVTITNGCTAGATLTMTSNSATSNALTRTGSDSGVKTIATTTGTTALDNNSWGYSLDNGANYAGIPLKNGTAATIYSGSTAGSKTVNVLYGVKTDNNLPSGTYTTDVVYTAAVSPSCLTYTVHFDTDGGTTFPDLTLNYGDKINLTNYIPTKSGYVFAGYSNGTSTYTGTETAADVNQSNAFAVTLRASY
ncbi:InlB B-repeat-containing protein, partial [Candidatus Saccharibacteria bacterium]|nr:InlB B-repeat-containing protein [Candidatus Saccharibacteria bacterium]